MTDTNKTSGIQWPAATMKDVPIQQRNIVVQAQNKLVQAEVEKAGLEHAQSLLPNHAADLLKTAIREEPDNEIAGLDDFMDSNTAWDEVAQMASSVHRLLRVPSILKDPLNSAPLKAVLPHRALLTRLLTSLGRDLQTHHVAYSKAVATHQDKTGAASTPEEITQTLQLYAVYVNLSEAINDTVIKTVTEIGEIIEEGLLILEKTDPEEVFRLRLEYSRRTQAITNSIEEDAGTKLREGQETIESVQAEDEVSPAAPITH